MSLMTKVCASDGGRTQSPRSPFLSLTSAVKPLEFPTRCSCHHAPQLTGAKDGPLGLVRLPEPHRQMGRD
jgi:hypothetical protein